MLDRITILNLADYKLPLEGKVFTGDIDLDLVRGEINFVDPRIPDLFKLLNNSFKASRWGLFRYSSDTLREEMSYLFNLDFKNKEEFINISIQFSGRYRYVALIDSGFFSESENNCIFQEKIETIDTDEVILEYNYLDDVINVNRGSFNEIPLSRLQRKQEYDLKLEIEVMNKFYNSFVFLDWRTQFSPTPNLTNIRGQLQNLFKLNEDYIWKIWEEYMPTLDLGFEKVIKDSVLFSCEEGKEPIYLPASCFGTGAITLFKILPVLTLKDRTIIVDNECSYFSELHPILKRHLLHNILFPEIEVERELLLYEHEGVLL